jgi:hypothetical protein
MAKDTDPALDEAHRKSIRHRALISAAARCGCFQCLAQFEPGAIQRWTDDGETALCPRCRVDSVLALEAGMDDAFLRRMKARWF